MEMRRWWTVLLLVATAMASGGGSTASDCVGLRNQLRKNGFDMSAGATGYADGKQAVCASSNKCCTPDVEAALVQWAQKDLWTAALSATQPLDQLLETTLADASERTAALLHRSGRETRTLMQQMYPSLAAQPDAQRAIAQLYDSLDKYLLTSSDGGNLRIKHLRVDVRETVTLFFAQLFSPAFLCVTMGEPCRAVNNNYSTCLVNNAAEFEPFGDEPKRLGKLLAGYIGEYRAIIASLRALQTHIADIKASFLPGRRQNEHCIRNVTRLKLCPMCSSAIERVGFCPDYCHDALQSCLYSDEWREKWDKALMQMNDMELTRSRSTTTEGENALAEFGRSVQLAITNIVETRAPAVAKNVVGRCGSLPQLAEKASAQSPATTKRAIVRTRSAPIESKSVGESLTAGIRNLTDYVGWWGRLTASLCRSADDPARCWNGTSVGRYVKASLPTAPAAAAPSTTAYPDHETMVARMTKINEILDEARFGKSRPGRRYGTETMLVRPEEEGTGEGLLQGDYNAHHPWGVDDEDIMDGSGSGSAPEHADVAEYADIGAPVWPDEPIQSKPPAKEKPLWTTSDTHPEDQSPAAKTASQRRWWSALAFALFVFAFVRW